MTEYERNELRETHISIVAMVADRAYKWLKPITTGFLDHAAPDARLAALTRELELNRRMAPDVYLAVTPLLEDAGQGCRLADAVMTMRRLPDDARLTRLLEAGGPEAVAALGAVAGAVARFHRVAARAPEIDAAGSRDATRALWDHNLAELRADALDLVDESTLEAIEVRAHRYLEGRSPLISQRIAEGCMVDGHGDLLCEDIFLLPDGPRVLDCLAFADELRRGDVLADLAFLVMDVERIAGPATAQTLVDAYVAASGEQHPDSLLHHWVAYRALVRAKVETIRAAQGERDAVLRAAAFLERVLDHLERAEVRLVLIGGAPGSGKTTLATELAARNGWSLVSSDATRRALFGDSSGVPQPGGAIDVGRYAPEAVARVYESMLHEAARLLGLGASVVLDASWSSAVWRERARTMAAGAAARVIEWCAVAPEAVRGTRIEGRLRRAEGVSDATPALSQLIHERFASWPEAATVDTDRPVNEVVLSVLAGSGRPTAWGA